MRKIIIDCDPGTDDAIAIMLALYSPEVEVIGITTVAGNAPQTTCAQNTLRILNLCNRLDVPVYEGAAQPMKRQLTFSGSYCGTDGLGESTLPYPKCTVQSQKAEDFIIEAVRRYKNIEILSIAPMTNLAYAIQKAPDIEWHQVKVVTMAGYYKVLGEAFSGRPRCEWNVLVDPEAFEVVVESGVQFNAIGLDITAQLENEMVDQILASAKPSRRLEFFKEAIQFNRGKGFKPYSLLVDSIPMAYMINPAVAEFTQGTIGIDYISELGQDTITFEIQEEIAHLQVAHVFDFEQYIQLLIERVFGE